MSELEDYDRGYDDALKSTKTLVASLNATVAEMRRDLDWVTKRFIEIDFSKAWTDTAREIRTKHGLDK